MAEEFLATLPQGETLRRKVLEGGLRLPEEMRNLEAPPSLLDPGFASRIVQAEEGVRAQFAILATPPTAKGATDLLASALIQLRQWAREAADFVLDPVTELPLKWR